LHSSDESKRKSSSTFGANGEAREDSDAHRRAEGGTASDSISPSKSFGADASSLFVVETDETLAVGSLESVLGVSNSLVGPDRVLSGFSAL
jgi:hypothetical protein